MKKILAPLFLAATFSLHASAQAPQAPTPPEFRLGDAATPTRYDLRLAIDPREAGFEGEVRIAMRVNRATPTLWLNADKLEITSAAFEQGGRTKSARATLSGNDFAGFDVEGGLEAGDAVATIRWKGTIDERSTRGLFRQKDRDRWYAMTQFEAINARRMMPCFDEPGWKTPWRVTLDAPESERALSNTPEESAAPIEGRPGWKRHVFAVTKPLPVYLVAFGVGPFEVVDGGKGGRSATALRYVTPHDRGSDAEWARAVTPKLLALLEDYFDRAYPFEKLDHATIPAAVGFGAMENVGFITYSSELMLSRPERESLEFRRAWASVASHEMAHQWFGDLVTMQFWNDVWLNEAFASWMARKTLTAYRPEWEDGWRSGENRRRAMGADRLMSARRIANPVANKDDIAAAFDAITYSKGAEVLAMFEAWLGEERFRAGVRRYLADHAYANASSTDFFRALGDASGRGEEAVAAFRSFIEQSGLPMVDVRLKCERGGATLELDQHRLIPKGAQGSEAQWITPACFRIGANGKVTKQCTEIHGRQELKLEAASCPDFVVGNANGAGHWVPRYDAPTLARLLRNVPRLPEAEAVALGDNTAMMLGSGLVTPADALAVARGLLAHPALGAKHAGVEIMDEVREDRLAAADRAAFVAIESQLLVPLAHKVGWKPGPKEALAMQELRDELLPHAVLRAHDATTAREARAIAHRWLQDPARVDASIGATVLHTAARLADKAFYDDMEGRLPAITERRDRVALLEALADVRDPELRNRALALAMRDGVIDSRDTVSFFKAALDDRVNGEPTLAFMASHWDRVKAKLPDESGTGTRFFRVAKGFCTPGAREQLEAFAPNLRKLQGGPQIYAQLKESVDICIASWPQ